MKYAQVSMFTVTLVLFACAVVQAQKPNQQLPTTPGQSVTFTNYGTDDPNTKAPFCDVIMPKALEELQKNASSTCRTATTCVRCTERTSGAEIYATLYAQPKDSKCNVTTEVAYDTKKIMNNSLWLYMEVLQSVCTREGVTLELSFPDTRVDLSLYTIVWEVDGQVVSQTPQANCVCGKTGSVTVTEKSTGRQTKKYMKLAAGCNSSKD
ncbi:MAG: hypothetical protein IPM98_14750 [Lewinellaceae bacterium]|nr:hypothetical protein [Lewinellaceae bacterium]